ALHLRKYLDGALTLATSILERFGDPAGGFFDTAVDAEKLITRPKDLFDNATPGANSVTADVLLRLALLTGNESLVERAGKTLDSIWPLAEKYPSGFGFLLSVAEWRAGQPKELAITGDVAGDTFRNLQRVIGETYLPHRVLAAGSESSDLPLLQHREMTKAMAYLCTGYACQEPVSDPERLRALLKSQ
ncbi:MAG: thioredoxin domain-containing protein, partial [Thermoanaerobaculia bacterium]